MLKKKLLETYQSNLGSTQVSNRSPKIDICSSEQLNVPTKREFGRWNFREWLVSLSQNLRPYSHNATFQWKNIAKWFMQQGFSQHPPKKTAVPGVRCGMLRSWNRTGNLRGLLQFLGGAPDFFAQKSNLKKIWNQNTRTHEHGMIYSNRLHDHYFRSPKLFWIRFWMLVSCALQYLGDLYLHYHFT